MTFGSSLSLKNNRVVVRQQYTSSKYTSAPVSWARSAVKAQPSGICSLGNVNASFPSPKVSLEQYPTSAHLAASVALAARDRGDMFDGCRALDLGCGTGMLAFSCALVLKSLPSESDDEKDEDEEEQQRTTKVTGVDVCREALERAIENAEIMTEAELMDDGDVEFVRAKLRYEPKDFANNR